MKRRDFLSLAAAVATLQMRPAWAQTFPTSRLGWPASKA